jgi:hypothetical protein
MYRLALSDNERRSPQQIWHGHMVIKKTARQASSTRNIQPARNTLMLSVSMPLELIALMDQHRQAHVPPLKRSQCVCALIINDLKSCGLINN